MEYDNLDEARSARADIKQVYDDLNWDRNHENNPRRRQEIAVQQGAVAKSLREVEEAIRRFEAGSE